MRTRKYHTSNLDTPIQGHKFHPGGKYFFIKYRDKKYTYHLIAALR